MKTKPTATLAAIAASLADHESAVSLLQSACHHLSTFSPEALYEVHVQEDGPGIVPIMVLGDDLSVACHKARRLDAEYNGRSSSLEVFIRCGEIRIAMCPSDVYDWLPEGDRGFTFTLDPRILTLAGPKVFKVGAVMPSVWYAKSPTPEREAVSA